MSSSLPNIICGLSTFKRAAGRHFISKTWRLKALSAINSWQQFCEANQPWTDEPASLRCYEYEGSVLGCCLLLGVITIYADIAEACLLQHHE
jgi:hypothetical protein